MGEKIWKQVSQPNVIKIYNEGMRGVDMIDRLLESYRPGTIMKYWCFFCLCDLYRSRDFGFVGFCERREHFFFIMVCVSLMDGLTENKAWRKSRAEVHFRLKESQPFR